MRKRVQESWGKRMRQRTEVGRPEHIKKVVVKMTAVHAEGFSFKPGAQRKAKFASS